MMRKGSLDMKIKSIVLFIILVAADQLSKVWAVRVLGKGKVIALIPGILELTYVENRGAAFGILQNRQWLFSLMTVIVLLGIIWVLTRTPSLPRFVYLRLICIILASGAVGNLIDRLRTRYVVDFIYFKPINFPVFNVADIYVTTASAALILLLLFFYKEKELDMILGKNREES